MQKSKIEWTDYSLNPVKGLCPMACDYCYARRMYKRFKWNPEIRYDPDWNILLYKMKPSRIFIGSMMELFGDWVKDEWLKDIFTWCRTLPQHTFIFLTKQPQKLIKWSPFPNNCQIGVSLTLETDEYGKDKGKYNRFEIMDIMEQVQAKTKFISFEPLLGKLCDGFKPSWWAEQFQDAGIKWIIIGQQTPISKKTEPKIEWIKDIVEAIDKAGISVFLKNNLKPLLPEEEPFCTVIDEDPYHTPRLRQEYPR